MRLFGTHIHMWWTFPIQQSFWNQIFANYSAIMGWTVNAVLEIASLSEAHFAHNTKLNRVSVLDNKTAV